MTTKPDISVKVTFQPITAADIEAWEAANPPREIINGQWAEEGKMAGQRHNLIGKRLFRVLDRFVEEKKLGEVYTDGLNYVLEGKPGQVSVMRIPDLSFVKAEKVKTDEEGFYYFAPDLAIEVVSPSETPKITAEKVADYLNYGTQQVWVIDPESKQVTVHQPEQEPVTYNENDILPGRDLLPGFSLKVAQLFEV